MTENHKRTRPQQYRRWDPEAFVRVWCAERSTRDVAAKLGRGVGDVECYAGRLRKLGVKLPSKRLPRFEDLDVNRLNALIDSMTDEEDTMTDDESTAKLMFMTFCAPILEDAAQRFGVDYARMMMKSAAKRAGLNPDEIDMFKVKAS